MKKKSAVVKEDYNALKDSSLNHDVTDPGSEHTHDDDNMDLVFESCKQ